MRKINFRIIFYGTVSFIVALAFARYIFELSIFHILYILTIIATILAVCLKFGCIKRFVFLLCVFIFGIGYYALGFVVFVGKDYQGTVNIYARVEQVLDYTTFTSCILDNVKINGKSKSFCIMATLSTDENLEQGNIITFTGKLTKVDLFEDGTFNSYYYKNNTPYKTTIKEILSKETGYLTLAEKVRNSYGEFVDKNFDEKVGGIVKSVVFGDKSTLDSEIKSSFSSSGIAHLLAISGLHISIIVAMINFVLKKFKLKQKYNFLILLCLLSIYCYFCDFAPSVMRASVMSLVYIFSGVVGRQYDRLSSISLSAFLILMFRPLYIFDAGFLLSFGCVFCIFVLSNLLKNVLYKTKLNRKLCDSLAIIVSVQLGLLPLVSLFYSETNLLSVFCNLVCVPLFEIAFILTFLLSFVCIILPFMGFLLRFVEFLYWLIVNISTCFSSATFAYVMLPKTETIFVVGFYSSCFVCSKFVNISKSDKLKIVTAILLISFIFSIFSLKI